MEKVSAMLKRAVGGTTSFEVVITQEIEVSAILNGGAQKKLPLFQGGGGGRKKFLTCDFPIL